MGERVTQDMYESRRFCVFAGASMIMGLVSFVVVLVVAGCPDLPIEPLLTLPESWEDGEIAESSAGLARVVLVGGVTGDDLSAYTVTVEADGLPTMAMSRPTMAGEALGVARARGWLPCGETTALRPVASLAGVRYIGAEHEVAVRDCGGDDGRDD